MLLIVLVVIFVMAMFLWMLSNLGSIPGDRISNNWLAFFAVLVLGIAVFLLGSGVVVWHR